MKLATSLVEQDYTVAGLNLSEYRLTFPFFLLFRAKCFRVFQLRHNLHLERSIVLYPAYIVFNHGIQVLVGRPPDNKENGFHLLIAKSLVSDFTFFTCDGISVRTHRQIYDTRRAFRTS